MGRVVPGVGTPIQDAIDGAGDEDAIYVHEGTYARECGCVETGYADRRWCGCVRLLTVQQRRRRRRGIEWWHGCGARNLVLVSVPGGFGVRAIAAVKFL